MPREKYPYYFRSIWNLLFEFKPRSTILRVFLQLPHSEDILIELVRSGIQFKTRGAMDIWTIKETFIDRFYEKFGAPISDDWSIIDVGCGLGDFSIFSAVNFPGNTVHAFEPTPDSFNLLLQNLSINNVSNVNAFPYAVWSSTGNLVMDTDQIEPGQYRSRSLNGASSSGGELVVPCLSLEDVFDLTGTAHCDLLKIDSEGAEYPILFNTPANILERIERIIMEYHEVPEFTRNDLEHFLTNEGFNVRTYPNYVHSHIGYLFAAR
jgi:FkbM family methyltransferase